MKLELKHLAPYLPYGLKLYYTHTKKIGQISNIYTIGEGYDNDDIKISIDYTDGEHIWMFKPILRPLLDITTTQILSMGYRNKITFKHDLKYNQMSWRNMNYLIENHFDVFGLIEKGLAIDINTLNK